MSWHDAEAEKGRVAGKTNPTFPAEPGALLGKWTFFSLSRSLTFALAHNKLRGVPPRCSFVRSRLIPFALSHPLPPIPALTLPSPLSTSLLFSDVELFDIEANLPPIYFSVTTRDDIYISVHPFFRIIAWCVSFYANIRQNIKKTRLLYIASRQRSDDEIS